MLPISRKIRKELDISEEYTKTIMKKIEETELLFPGSLYWLDKKKSVVKTSEIKKCHKKSKKLKIKGEKQVKL